MQDGRDTTVGERYRCSRLRLTGLLEPLDERSWNLPVDACPGWRVRDVLAHLVGIIEDAAAGRISGPPTPTQTAVEIERHRADDPAELLRSWSTMAPIFESAISQGNRWPAAFDALSHEHDVRTVLGRQGARDDDDVRHAATLLLGGLPAQLIVDLPGEEPDAASEPGSTSLTTSAFEFFRLRLGRRSRSQVLQLEWIGDPEPFVDQLFIFGPAIADLRE